MAPSRAAALRSGTAGEDPPARCRKKALGVRTWLSVDPTGAVQNLETGKPAIMRRTGLPARDLRILDPLLSYPSTVLGRERAIVINIERIKAIITAHEVLLLNARDPSVQPFVRHLQNRIALHNFQKEGRNIDGEAWRDDYDAEEPHEMVNSVDPSEAGTDKPQEYLGSTETEKGQRESGIHRSNGPRTLPFEFVALEACLEHACSCLENEAMALEKEAHPALDKLTSKISTLNLERVRQIKSRLVDVTGRVQKVRDELEQLLDDDDDMAEMYLTDKLLQQQLFGRSSLSSQDEADDDERINANISLDENDVINNNVVPQTILSHDQLCGRAINKEESLRTSSFANSSSSSKHINVEELEMLLEAYFVQIDSTLNKLSTLKEYVDDTEDYISIMLDDKQNHLLQMGVMLTTATLIVSAFVVVAGIFGMNIQNDLFNKNRSGTREFLWTVGGGATSCLLLYICALTWCKHRRLLE